MIVIGVGNIMDRKIFKQNSKDKIQREEILHEFVEHIKSAIPSNGYALKGGYILKTILDSCGSTKDIRYTTDIDVSLSCEEYQELLINAVSPYLEELKLKGVIYSYSVERLGMSKNGLPTSGRIILYKKPNPNVKKRIFCGIDFDLHPLFYGIVKFSDGTTAYSLSRSIGDKFLSLYLSDDKKLLHRVKDIIDLYLINQYLTDTNREIDFDISIRSIHDDLLKIYKLSKLPPRSNLELLLIKSPETLYNEVGYILKTERLNKDLLNYSTVEGILEVAVSFINTLRSEYYELYK